MTPIASFARRFFPLWALGLCGVAALALQAPPAALVDGSPTLRELPNYLVRLLLLVNPLILLTVMAAVGAACAPRVGLRSALAGDPAARLDARLALTAGLVLALLIGGTDLVLADALGPDWQRLSADAASRPWLPTLLMGALYGGLTEEIVMRWGLMGLVAWGLMAMRPRAVRKEPEALPPLLAWVAIAVAGAAFAVGHLPALAQGIELTGPLLARTLGLNLVAGLAYGWLFWRRGLECAMLAHASTHLGFALVRWVA